MAKKKSRRQRKGARKQAPGPARSADAAPKPKAPPEPRSGRRAGPDPRAEEGGAGFLERWGTWLVLGLAALLYVSTAGHQYALDDLAVLYENHFVKQGLAGIDDVLASSYWAGFSDNAPTFYRPLSLVTFCVEVQLAEGAPGLLHLDQVLLYMASAGLVYTLLKALLGWRTALLTSLLWVAHPVHSEVVANLKSRDELLGFLLGTLTLWLAHKGRLRWAALSFFGAMLSKESLVTYVAVLPAMLWMLGEHRGRELLRRSLVPLPGVLAYFLCRLGATGSLLPDAPVQMDHESQNALFAAEGALEQWGTVLSLAGRYAELLVLPRTLVFDYSIGQIPIVGPGDPYALLGIAALAATLGVVLWKRRGPWAFGAFYLLATYSVVSNAVLWIRGSTMAERFVFTPSLGLCLLVALALLKLPWRAAWAATLVLVLAGSARTLVRLPAWENNDTLFSTDLFNAPGNPRAVTHFGVVRMDMLGRMPDREAELEARTREGLTLAIDTWLSDPARYRLSGSAAWGVLGDLEKTLGHYEEAEEAYQRALEIDPEDFRRGFDLGWVRHEQGDHQASAEAYERALATRDASPLVGADATPTEAYCLNLCVAYLKLERLDDAERLCQRAVDTNPRYAQAWAGLGKAAELRGDTDQAAELYEKARHLDPGL